MKLITFKQQNGEKKAGWLSQSGMAVDMHQVSNGALPDNMLALLDNYEHYQHYLKTFFQGAGEGSGHYPLNEVQLLAPLPNPRSIRDFYAFEQHVKTARQNRGLSMVKEWYSMPVFYFTNSLAVHGPGDQIFRPKACRELDYELEIACVIGKKGRNVLAENAEEYIFGFTVMNDWSARDLQREEMQVGLGPAKGKDFATSFGPAIVTADELEPFRSGKGYNLMMKASVNGVTLSFGNVKDLYYSFGEMIERASAGTTLYPGEILGSGTVGTGCILELGTDIHRWLEPGDTVEIEIEGLGKLKNIIAEE
ncbi:fumarylacetoacetate hydrolase family protein [Bacillus lacus]|uniref:Fumarylacetoacetate hydrolase family protein n=1 Tax=Metabacillus lacus TaxID=1983721 RepID=A0A7X2IY62_9BACI|nr:fumarylacetoacetate hydrolase family protein [Metabacillus lacus]MRX71830.1 fumarylacetoacetate hydrolase family protein [Metabacillus lacus]